MSQEYPDGLVQAGVDPLVWGETLSGAPLFSGRLPASSPVLVRRWTGVNPEIDQPPLDHHYFTLHLGGPKRIRRAGEGREAIGLIAEGSYSVTPAGSAFTWATEGPIDFAHIYLKPSSLDDVMAREFDRDPRRVSVGDTLGARDPLMESLLAVVSDSLTAAQQPSRAYWDGLMHTLSCRLLHLHSTVASSPRGLHLLAPTKVARVIEFIRANLALDIGVLDMARVAGVSPFHFSRGFRRATGLTPYAFLIQRRIERAKELLLERRMSISDVARACGFATHSQFSTMFKRVTGISPSHHRARY